MSYPGKPYGLLDMLQGKPEPPLAPLPGFASNRFPSGPVAPLAYTEPYG